MALGAASRRSRFSSYGRLAAIGLSLLAVLSPLYIDRRTEDETETEEEPIDLGSWLPLLLLGLILAITVSSYLDTRLNRCDPYWIHRAGGSSGGIVLILVVLVLVLKCKASVMSWEALPKS